jgi:hypothetical protein
MTVEITLADNDLSRDEPLNPAMLGHAQRAMNKEFPAAKQIKVFYRDAAE